MLIVRKSGSHIGRERKTSEACQISIRVFKSFVAHFKVSGSRSSGDYFDIMAMQGVFMARVYRRSQPPARSASKALSPLLLSRSCGQVLLSLGFSSDRPS